MITNNQLINTSLLLASDNRFEVNKFWQFNKTNILTQENIFNYAKYIIGNKFQVNIIDKIKELENRMLNGNIKWISYYDDYYPSLLKNINQPPLVLFYKSKRYIPKIFNKSISIIGTRHPNNYGIENANIFSSYFSKIGYTTISGLALGIDSLVHKNAVEINARSVAVLPCSIDKIYPLRNIELAEDILRTDGVIISEYLNNREIDRSYFKIRNRIISGLSKLTLLIQSKLKSGSIITAIHAFENNRDVYAIPGNINDILSEGPNHLIKNCMAQIVTKPSDILLNNY